MNIYYVNITYILREHHINISQNITCIPYEYHRKYDKTSYVYYINIQNTSYIYIYYIYIYIHTRTGRILFTRTSSYSHLRVYAREGSQSARSYVNGPLLQLNGFGKSMDRACIYWN